MPRATGGLVVGMPRGRWRVSAPYARTSCSSRTPRKCLPCGHFMHTSCFQAYTKHYYTCPLCRKSLGDFSAYFRMLDAILAEEGEANATAGDTNEQRKHPGDRASAAHPVQEAGGRRGGTERAVQLRLPVFLLATRVAEGRGVLDVMAVSTLPSKMRPNDQVETAFHLQKHHGTLRPI